MPLVELFLASRSGTVPPRAVAITFDDGYADALTTAAPLLAQEGLPATFFVNTERLDEPHEGWHDEIEHVLVGDAPLPSWLELATPDGSLRLDVATPELRRHAQMTLHGIFWSATVEQREAMLEGLATWSGVPRAARTERRVMSADEVLALSRMPKCEIGSHSVHHLVLPRHSLDIQRSGSATRRRHSRPCSTDLWSRSRTHSASTTPSYRKPFGRRPICWR